MSQRDAVAKQQGCLARLLPFLIIGITLCGLCAIVGAVSPRIGNNMPSMSADSYPCQSGQVKGSYNTKLYHVPGDNAYARTKANVVCFDTEEEAKAAGYGKAQK